MQDNYLTNGGFSRFISRRERCHNLHKLLCKKKPKRGDPCVKIPGHVAHKPDPCIYSQFLLMRLGKPVTWDNPDVKIFLNGVEQDTYNLTADTEYDVEITVHNSSREKPANSTQVHVRYVEFGAGGQTKHLVATLVRDVPVWPGTVVAATQWRTPAIPGHYCIEVELVHPNDGNPSNNVGWNNTQVYAASSPVNRPVRVFNQYPRGCPIVREGGGFRVRPHRIFAGWAVLGLVAGIYFWSIHQQEDGYRITDSIVYAASGYAALSVLGLLGEWLYTWAKRQRRPDEQQDPQTVDCHLVEISVDSYQFNDEIGKNFDPTVAFQGQAAVWPARVEPSTFRFSDGEIYRDVELLVDAPDDPGPPGTFNVSVTQAGVPVGGVTVTITRGGA